jgi:membrane-bound lytic murein transglycosylase A
MLRYSLLLLLMSSTAWAQLEPTAAPPLTVACDDLDLPSLVAAVERELPAVERSKPDYAARVLEPILALAKADDRAHLCGTLQYSMKWMRLGGVMFTAYHTPTVRGSLVRDATYRFPLYKRPNGALAQLSTAQILAGGLAGRGLELVWLADAYDALALHVEGAGVVTLPDGTLFPVGSNGHNGQAYQNVSKLLIADHKLPPGPPPPSTGPGNPKARAYFAAHPAELDVYWGRNPHFVFFRHVEHAGSGKYGALVAGRSVAVDEARVPMGALLYVRAQPFTRVVVAQDTGAGIRGQRIDVYYGEDQAALVAAQSLTVQGDAWVLMPK